MYCLKRHNLNISARVLARVMQANLPGDRNATKWGRYLQVLTSAELPMIISSKLLALQIDDREGTSGRAQRKRELNKQMSYLGMVFASLATKMVTIQACTI